MPVDQIRETLRSTFRSAETIWGAASPFQPYAAWFGYSATKDQAEYLSATFGNEVRPFPPGDPRHKEVMDLFRYLLPDEGRALFDTGFAYQTLYVDPPKTLWTPSGLVSTMATDPNDGNRKFALFTIPCGEPKP